MLIAISKHIKYIVRNEWFTTAEDIWVTLTIGKHKTHLCCVYLPPVCHIDIFKSFLYNLHDICLKNPSDNVIVLGDFNVPDFSFYTQQLNVNNYRFINPSDRAKCDLIINTLNLCNLSQYSNNRILDLVFSNIAVVVNNCTSPLINIDKFHPALVIEANFKIDYNLSKN